MKKLSFLFAAAVLFVATGCNMGSMGNSGNALGGVLNGATVGNVLTSVLGLDKVSQQQLIGTWKYAQPGCAFTSKDLLSKAGGEVVAQQIKQKLTTHYQAVGINSSNTQVTFTQDGHFTLVFAGKQLQGTYTYDEANYKISMKGLLLSINCYAKRNANGIGLLFETSKLLTILQTLATLSGNQTLSAIGDLTKQYDGVRIGFDMTK